MRKLESWPGTIVRSVFLGAVVGSSSLTLLLLAHLCLGSLTKWPQSLLLADVLRGAFGLLLTFAYSFILWLLGIVLLGLGPWWVLHHLGLTNRLVAAALGFLAPFGFCFWLMNRQVNVFCVEMGVIGILVAQTVWYSAYRYGPGGEERPRRM